MLCIEASEMKATEAKLPDFLHTTGRVHRSFDGLKSNGKNA